MIIENRFALDHPAQSVWDALCDVRVVAGCLPGASIVEELGEQGYRGRLALRLGPIAAAFDGEMTLDSDPGQRVATVRARGVDARSASRVSTQMRYAVREESSARTVVTIRSEIALAGALAQFGKAAVLQEIANRITDAFVHNFQQALAQRTLTAIDGGAALPQAAVGGEAPTPSAVAPAAAPASAPPPRPLDVGGLFWQMLRERLVRWFGLRRWRARGRTADRPR